ncbi:MAG: hypothetical protein K5878_13340 [Rhizobiaceae bacterium]|nr:hypothetical protein [Rhizobiaceae bacterium]
MLIGGWIAATCALAIEVGAQAHRPRTPAIFDPPEGLARLQHGAPDVPVAARQARYRGWFR